MQCNQSFCGNGFNIVPQVPIYSSPLHCNQNIYPEIVGEGEVTSVTLPDGTVQYFFMPTVKWWSTGPVQCQPAYPTPANPMFANMNSSNPCNMGSWFNRGISNPLSQNGQPRSCFASDYNMNCVNNGFHVKFHNDNCTSTTDLHYFCPSLLQGVIRSPYKGTAAVQISTLPNTMCHYEVVCAKPCNCARPMSLESLVEPKKLKSQNNIASTDCSCDDLKKNLDIQAKKQKKNKRPVKLKSTCACACESTDKTKNVDKSVTTYADQCISCASTDGRETQTHRGEKTHWFKKVTRKKSGDKNTQANVLLNTDSVCQRCDGKDVETWQPVTPLSKKVMDVQSSEVLLLKSSSNKLHGCHSSCSSLCSSCMSVNK